MSTIANAQPWSFLLIVLNRVDHRVLDLAIPR
jgi:hypothetical protein